MTEMFSHNTRLYYQVGLPLYRTPLLTYHWDGKTPLDVGTRIITTLKHRKVMGIVMQSCDKPQVETKPIVSVVDGPVVINEEIAQLAIASQSRFAVSMGDVLMTMLVKGLTQNIKLRIEPTGQHAKPLTPVEKNLMDRLEKAGSWDFKHFSKQRKEEMPTLKALEKKGWVKIGVPREQKLAKPKTNRFLSIMHVDDGSKKGRIQQEILRRLEKSKRLPDHAFVDISPTVQTSIRNMVKKGWLTESFETANTTSSDFYETSKAFALSQEQQRALSTIDQAFADDTAKEILLHGVTGSGKTEVYLQATQTCLEKGKNVLALVPEISLTPQFLHRFVERFGSRISLLHSQRTDQERLTEWMRISQGDASVVVGTRSAVFAPLDNIGLIIMDECHDDSYKQQDGLRYHALDLIRYRARHHGCPVLMGSATPNVETYFQANTLIKLEHRVTGHELPEVEIVNMKDDKDFGKKSWIGQKLRERMTDTLREDRQVLLFLNRRGYSHIVYCYRCGKQVNCPHCDVTMTFHKTRQVARCHYCFYEHDMQSPCPTCHDGSLVHFGMGTQKIEEELSFLFPDAVVARLDRDQTHQKNLFSNTLTKMSQGKIDILIGTQMITKGLDLPNIGLVGMVLADQSLYFPDYRAAETTFQLITQVVGRSGRGAFKGRALIQTLQPEHYAITSGATQDYQTFYDREIEHRKALGFPPFSHLVLLEAQGSDAKRLDDMMGWLATQAQETSSIELMGPAPAPIGKVRDDYRYHLLMRSQDPKKLFVTAKWLFESSLPHFEKQKLKLHMDVNPCHFL